MVESFRERAYPPHRIDGCFERLLTQIQLLPIVGGKHEMTDGRGRDARLPHVLYGRDVADAFRHLRPLRQEKGAMAPESGKRPAGCRFRLGDLVLVVREDEVDAAAMDVEGLAKEIQRHRGALQVPAGPAAPPRRVPRRARPFVFGFCRLPKSEILRVLF